MGLKMRRVDMDSDVLVLMQSIVGTKLSQHSPSPLGRWLDGTLVKVERGELQVEFTIREEMTNPAGILQGGIATAMMDEVMGMMVMCLGLPYFYTSVNLTTDFLKISVPNEVITATGKLLKQGETIINTDGFLHNQQGKLVARCTSNFLKTTVPVKHPQS